MKILIFLTTVLFVSASPVGIEERPTAAEPPDANTSSVITEEELETFTPSEEIRADSAVSFPANI